MEEQTIIPEDDLLSVSEQLKNIYEKDQEFRTREVRDRMRVDPEFRARIEQEVRKQDKENRVKVTELLEKGITKPLDLDYASRIFQHGETLEDYQMALNLALKAVEAGIPPEYSIVTQATDRVLVEQQKKAGVPLDKITQKFGTQGVDDPSGEKWAYPLDGTVTQEEVEMYKPLKPT